MQKKSRNQTAADFIRRLPLHRQLDASQAMLIKLSPIWLGWARHTLPHTATESATENCQLNALQNGKLSLHCNNATLASQIKHQSRQLINHFHEHGFNDVQEIVVRLRPSTHIAEELRQNRNTQQLHAKDSKNHFVAASDNSLNAIENCRMMVKSDELSNALARLAETLKSSKTDKN